MTKIEKKVFGQMPCGTEVYLYTLTNKIGASVSVSTYGGYITSIIVPDKNGKLGEVVCGFPTFEGYLKDTCYIGATVGRYANRIAKGKITLKGVEYTLPVNNGPNCLHGGVGFSFLVFDAETTANGKLALSLTSPDGDQGFPGTLKLKVIFSWSEACELTMQFIASSDKDTVANFTNHAYFNLKGEGSAMDHELYLNCDKFLPMDEFSTPLGEMLSVKGTPMDFTTPKAIGKEIDNFDFIQLKYGKGYDHCFVGNKKEYGELSLLGRATEKTTGRTLEVLSTLPGVQLYTANWLNSELPGHFGKCYEEREAFCLEAQYFPDSPNQGGFNNVILKAGQQYDQTIIFKFS